MKGWGGLVSKLAILLVNGKRVSFFWKKGKVVT